ncbi:hypothetical protein DL96DRAFT_1563569 [Flagelloscypha sp. PMI_526]|nr:hypothetical protein DL96DRAFT_1563569 [Flagelloscypha sp. PMI_526]
MSDAFVSGCLQLSALASMDGGLIEIVVVLYWDHILMLPDEIQYLWKWPVCRGAGLFFLNRYLTSLGNIPVFYYTFLEGNPMMCGIFKKYHQTLIIVPQVIVTELLADGNLKTLCFRHFSNVMSDETMLFYMHFEYKLTVVGVVLHRRQAAEEYITLVLDFDVGRMLWISRANIFFGEFVLRQRFCKRQ